VVDVNPDAVLQFVDITVRRGSKVLLDGINWTVEEDERWAILGPAGIAVGLVAGGSVGGVVEASHIPKRDGAFFDEIRADALGGLPTLLVPESWLQGAGSR